MSKFTTFRVIQILMVLLLLIETSIPAVRAEARPLAEEGASDPWQLSTPQVQNGESDASLESTNGSQESDHLGMQALSQASASCVLYPIALYAATLAAVQPGQQVSDILNGSQPGNFGWLSWNGNVDVPSLVASLTPPGNSGIYINPQDAADYTLSMGDWVHGRPGAPNSSNLRSALNALKQRDITVPVWDTSEGSGANSSYHIVQFANVRLLSYQLAGQNRISASFLGYNTACGEETPEAIDDSYQTPEETELAVNAPGVLVNDSVDNCYALTTLLITPPSHGVLTLHTDGSFVYMPALNYVGSDSFTYRARNANGQDSNIATVTITVLPINDDPIAVDDNVSTDEESAVEIAALSNDTDVDPDTLVVAEITAPQHGEVSTNPNGSVTYLPALNFCGVDGFTYMVSDGHGGQDEGSVAIEVACVPDMPTSHDDTAATDEDVAITIPVLENDHDGDGDVLAVQTVTTAGHGMVAIQSGQTIRYTPAALFHGSDSFTYTACDPGGLCADAAVTVVVNGHNHAPQASDDTLQTDEDTPVTVEVAANDSDVDDNLVLETITIQLEPAHGTLTSLGNGRFIYEPTPNFHGEETFSYEICDDGTPDGTVLCDSADVVIAVSAVNDEPQANGDQYPNEEDTQLTIPAPGLLANDTDDDVETDGDVLTVADISDPEHGTLDHDADGSFTYLPAEDFCGADTFSYHLTDGKGTASTATVTIETACRNDNPVAEDEQLDVEEDTLLTVDAPGILGNDGDVDGDSLFVVTYNQPTFGTLVQNGDGSLSYMPFSDVCGSDSYTYSVDDGNGGLDEGIVTLKIACVNDAPLVTSDTFTYTVHVGQTLVEAAPGVLANDTDIEGSPLSAVLVDQPAQGTLILEPDGSFTYTPYPGTNGSDTFTYQASDGITASEAVSVSLVVIPKPVEQSGRGVIAGEIYDDATGLPIADAAVELLSLNGVTPTSPVAVSSDGRGRFQLVSDAGVARLHISKAGFTTVERTATVVEGRIVLPFDARLTPLDGNEVLVTSLLGGTLHDSGEHATLSVPPFALNDDQEMRLSWISGQGLSGRLPLGWSPLAVVDLFPHDLSFDEAATLSIPLPSGLPAEATVTVVRWNAVEGEWFALGNASRSDAGLYFDLMQTGQVALLLPDAAQLAPPAPVVGQAIYGAEVVSMPVTLTATMDPSPKVHFATPDARSQVGVQVAAEQPLQSGTAIQAGLDDRYDFFDTTRLAPGSITQDFTLYRYPFLRPQLPAQLGAGATGPLALRAEFAVSPSRSFDPYALQLGTIDLQARRPLALETPLGIVLMASGGRVVASNGAAVTIPPVAAPATDGLADASENDLPVLLSPLTLDEIPLELPDTLDFVGGVALDLYGAPLHLPATLSMPAPAGYSASDQLLVVQLVEAHGASYFELVATGALQGNELVTTVDPRGDGTVPLPGIRGEGRYLFLRAQADLGYIVGIANGSDEQPLDKALVTVDTLPIVAVSDENGRYVLAAPLGAVNVTAIDAITQDAQVQNGEIAAKNEVLPLGFSLVAAAPTIFASDPEDEAGDISPLSMIKITFSKVIDRASVTPGVLTLSDHTGAVTGTLSLLPGDRILSFQPQAPLDSDTAYTITVSTAIRDPNGRAMQAPFVSTFSTKDTTPPLPSAAGAIAATIPNDEGYSTVTGSQGTAEPGWTVSISNTTTHALTTVLPESDGSFSVLVPALPSDSLEVLLRDASGNQTRIPVPPFRNPDGSTVVGTQGGIVEGEGGVSVIADPGALPNGTVVKVEPITQEDDLPIPLPPVEETNLNFLGGLHVDLGGVTPIQPVDVSIPAPTDATVTDTVLVLRSVELTQAITLPNGSQVDHFWTLSDRAHLDAETWTYRTASPPFPGISVGGSYAFLRPGYIINPGLDRQLQTEPRFESDDQQAKSYDANGEIDIIRPGADGKLDTNPKSNSDDERRQECMGYVNISYSFGLYLYPYASIVGAFFLHPLTQVGDVTMIASCNQPIRIRAFAPDTGSVLAEITTVAPATRNQILYPQNGLTNDHDAPYVVSSVMPTDFHNNRQEVTVSFSEKMHPQSVQQHFKVFDGSESAVSGEIEILYQNSTVLFRPHVAFRLGERYSVVFTGTTDFAGNPVSQGMLSFERAAPGSLGELRNVEEINQALTKCDAAGACYSAARDVVAVGNTIFFANGINMLGEQYPDPANPKRIVVVDTSNPAAPKLIGWHRTNTDPRSVAILRDISFSYVKPQAPAGQREQFSGDLLVVIGGGRPGATFANSARLEVYDVTACFKQPLLANCLDEQTLHPLVGEKYLSTGPNIPQRVGVPPEPGVAAELDLLHRRQSFAVAGAATDGLDDGNTVRREDTAVAYVVVVPIGLESVNIVDAYRTFAKQSTAADRYAPDGIYRGDFYDVAVVKNDVAAAEMPSAVSPRMRLFTMHLLPIEGVPVPRAFRLATGENFVFDLDRDGNLGQGEDEDNDVLTGMEELFDLTVIASGGRSSSWGQGELYVVDVSHETELEHDEPARTTAIGPEDTRVLSRIPLPGAAADVCVDRLAQVAYVNMTGQGLAVVDLSHILSVLRGELSARWLIDENFDLRDDRILYIYQNGSNAAQAVKGIDCKDMPWAMAAGGEGDEGDPELPGGYEVAQPGTVILNWEKSGGEILGNFNLSAGSPVVLETEVDVINKTTCEEGDAIDFFLSHPAKVTITIDGTVMQADGDLLEEVDDGVDDGPMPVEDVHLPAGHHSLPVPVEMALQSGEYPFQIHALFLEGDPDVERTATGSIVHNLVMRSALPIGHMMVGGVDLWDGHLTHSSQDLMIPGRGLSLEFARSYSSGGSDNSGSLGAGWSHNLDVRLIRDNCGRLVVIGGEGTGNTFTNPHTDAAKAALFASNLFAVTPQALFYTPQMGYHSTLIQNPQALDEFDFFTKGHVRYHFKREAAFPGEIFLLRFIEEPNGNRLTFDYLSIDHDAKTLDIVTDSSGRLLRFTYAQISRSQRIVQVNAQVVAAADQAHDDLNIQVNYGYDGFGNLVAVTRTTPYAGFHLNDERVERYGYSTDHPVDPHNLRSYTDPNGHVTNYLYYAEGDNIPGYNANFKVAKHEIIKGIQQPEGVTTSYFYTISTNANVPNLRAVDDPRAQVGATLYTLNNYGAAVQVDAPLGRTTQTTWCTDEPLDSACASKRDVLMAEEIDALGRTFRYQYDELGNMLNQTIDFSTVTDDSLRPVTGASGNGVAGVTTHYTYDPLFSKVTSKRDAEGNTTWYCLDSPSTPPSGSPCQPTGGKTGNQLAIVDAEGNVTSHTYAANGDRLTSKDAEGRTTHYNYDQFGNVREVIDPLGHITTTEYDARSRSVKMFDDFGHQMEVRYDALDRPIAEKKVNQQSDSGPDQVKAYRYLPGGQVTSITSGLTQMPAVGVPLSGLLTQGHTTEYFYDDMNRQVKVVERGVLQPDAAATRLDLTTELTYDPAGNIVQEINQRGIIQKHTYDALNRRTLTTVSGPFAPGEETIYAATYDAADNKRSETNLHGATTTYIYDMLYQAVETQLPFQHDFVDVPFQDAKIVKRYNLAGALLSETDANGYETEYVYDDIYRLQTRIDAEGNSTTYEYDKVGNKSREENLSSGLVVEYSYDSLNRVSAIKQIVPAGEAALPPATYITTYQYEDADNAVVVTNPRGIKSRTDKDGLDQVYRIVVDTDDLKLTTTNTYDAFGNLKSVRDAEGGDIDVTYEYDGLGRKIRATYASTPDDDGQAVVETFAYDGNSNVIRYVNQRQIEFAYTYDNLDRKLTEVMVEAISNGGEPLTLATSIYNDTPNAQGLYTTLHTDANGNTTRLLYDRLDRLTRLIDPLNNEVHIAYDGVNKRSETSKRGQVTRYTYDAINRPLLTEEFDLDDALQTSAQVEYLDAQNRIIATDRRGVATIQQNDALGRLVKSSRAGLDMAAHYGQDEVVLERYEYDGNGNVILAIDGQGNRTTYTYDGADRKRTMTAGAGSPVQAVTTWTYDNVGNVLTIKDGRAHAAASASACPHASIFDVCYTYDARYRQVSETNGAGETTHYSYDAAGNVVAMTEPLGPTYTTHYRYDELNQLLAVDETPRAQDGTAGVTRYLYDANRNKIAQQDAIGNLITYRYNALNQLTDTFQHTTAGALDDNTRRDGALGGNEATALHWHYGYDINGNQTLIVDAEGQQVEKHYDYLDRLVIKNYTAHSDPDLDFQVEAITYAYDANSNTVAVSETKLLSGNPIVESTRYAYDPLDRVQSVTRRAHDDLAGKTIAYDYDVQGNRTVVIDSDSISTTYSYDARNRLSTVTTDAGVTRYSWWEDDLLKEVLYPNFTNQDRSFDDAYDSADRIRRIENRHVGPVVEPYSTYAYSYDANGNRLTQVESQIALGDGEAQTTTYTYDTLNRLATVDYDTDGSVLYTYDAAGNRLSEQGTDPRSSNAFNRSFEYGALAEHPGVTFDGVNALTRIVDHLAPAQTVTYEYDANLNQVARVQNEERVEYHYDIRDQMVAAAVGSALTRFDYDAGGMRIKKISAGEETRYLYDDMAVLVETDGAGQTTHKYDYGYALLALTTVDGANRASQFYLTDALKSTTNLADEGGELIHSYRYDVWGNMLEEAGNSSNPRQYTGHYHDDETGLDYFGARYYDSESGRFLSQDTYLGEANTPPSLHRYLYAYANPLRYVDLHGYSSEEINPEQFNSSAMETTTDDKQRNVTTTQRGGYSITRASGSQAAALANWLNGEHPTKAAETEEEMTGAWAGDTARRVQRYAKEVKQEYEQQVQDDPSFLNILGATIVTTALDTAAALSDPLKLGEGAAKGGWGWAEDAFRLMDLIDMTKGVGALARHGFRTIAGAGAKHAAASRLAHVADDVAEVALRQSDNVAQSVLRQADEVAGMALKQTDDLAGQALRRVDVDDAIGVSCALNSFAADTLVATANGLVPIQDIVEGDSVLAFDEFSGATGTYSVTATMAHLDPVVVILTLDGEQIETTPEHPFYRADGEWILAGNLEVGDRIQQADDEESTVRDIEIFRRSQVMYNLTVFDAHTFFIGSEQWLVHNACPGGLGITGSDVRGWTAGVNDKLREGPWGRYFEAGTRTLQEGYARRHILPLDQMVKHFDTTLSPLSVKAAIQKLTANGIPVQGRTWDAVRQSVAGRLRHFNQDPRNLWIGLQGPNRAVSTAMDYPRSWSPQQIAAHTRYMQQTYFLK